MQHSNRCAHQQTRSSCVVQSAMIRRGHGTGSLVVQPVEIDTTSLEYAPCTLV